MIFLNSCIIRNLYTWIFRLLQGRLSAKMAISLIDEYPPLFLFKGGLCFCRKVILWSRYFSTKLCSARSRQTTKCRIRKVDKTGRIQYQDSIMLQKYGLCIKFCLMLLWFQTFFIFLYFLLFVLVSTCSKRTIFHRPWSWDIFKTFALIFQRLFPHYIKTFQSRFMNKTSL